MKARLFRYTIYSAILPLVGVLAILSMKSISTITTLILLLTTLAQIPVLLFCKRELKQFIKPDIDVLKKLHVPFVPAAYEPGRFKTDSRVASVIMWFTVAAPFTAWLAVQNPEIVHISVLNDAVYFSPAMYFLIPMIFSLLFGILAFPFWFETARANEVFSEGSEEKRYLMMGFTEYTEQEYYAVEYVETLNNRKFA